MKSYLDSPRIDQHNWDAKTRLPSWQAHVDNSTLVSFTYVPLGKPYGNSQRSLEIHKNWRFEKRLDR